MINLLFYLDGQNCNSKQGSRSSVEALTKSYYKRNLDRRLPATICSYALFCSASALVSGRDWKIVGNFSVCSLSKACLHFSAGFLCAVC